MFSQQAATLKKIAESRDVIRQKSMQLKSGLEDMEDKVTKVFKPIIRPLNKIADSTSRVPSTQNAVNNNKVVFQHSTPQKKSIVSSLLDNMDYSEVAEQSTKGADIQFSDHFASELGEDISSDRRKVEELPEMEEEEAVEVEKEEANGAYNSLTQDTKKMRSHVISDFLKQIKARDSKFDQVLGVRKLRNGYKIGDSDFSFSDKEFRIGRNTYPMTSGLTELIFKNYPDRDQISLIDRQNYRKIIGDTHALHKNYNPHQSLRQDKSRKYFAFIDKGIAEGTGLPTNMIASKGKTLCDYIYWDDPNELVERLKLLIAERSAGNMNHDNEIQSIIEELREAQLIY